MPENLQIQTNAVASISSNGHLDHIQEGVSRMKMEEEEERREYPNRPGEPDCNYYVRTGNCGYGSTCRFNHPSPSSKTDQNTSELPLREGQPDCGFFLKTGTCKYGSECKYHHPVDRRNVGQVSLNALGLPIREQEKPCPFYMRTFTCKFGAACKFDHPQPAAIEMALPVSGPTAVGIGSALPSTGIPYAGALPAWSFTKSSYVASSQVPVPHSYMPVVIPPLQVPVPAQSWNNYLEGSMSSVAASSVMGTDLIFNKNPGELLANTIFNLPERPDQPKCRYFMSTGNCKYGINCKFHHPSERIAHCLGPHGLPLRPGEDICAHFSSYGICKYGPICKFNHPIAGYFPGYYFGMPFLPVLNQPFFPNQRNLVISNSTETSQSKSSKITDWVQKPETVGGRNQQNSVTKAVEDPHEPVADDSNAASGPTPSDIPHDQTD